MKIFQKLLISSVATTLVIPVLAQDTLKITVTGTRSPKPVDSYPGTIEVIEKDELSIKSGSTIKELTNDIPGVSVKKTKRSGVVGPSGNGNVNIRGLDFQRVLFLVDGIRLPEAYKFSSYYNFDQGSYVDFNTLSSVEILKGPASALYGADALGGVVSYRTIKPKDLLKKDQKFAVEIPVNYDSSNNGLTESIKFATKLSDKTSLGLIYTKEDGEETKVKADPKYIDDEEFSGNNYLANLTYDFDEFTSSSIVYENLSRETTAISTTDNLSAMSSRYATYTSLKSDDKTNRDRISFEYEYDNPDNDKLFKFFRTKIYSQYAKANDNFDRTTTAYGFPTFKEHEYYLKNDSFGADLEFHSEFNDSKFTYGIDYSEVDTSRLRTTRTIGASTEVAKDTPDTDINRTGVYIQNEFSKGKFDFISGLRYDNYELDAKPDDYVSSSAAFDLEADKLSPKLAVTYNINDDLSTYAQYSQGFRAPAYYEVNANFSNPMRGYTTISNPDLEPETSNSYEVGLRGRYSKIDFDLSGFYNKYENFIEQLVNTGVVGGLTTYQTQNVDSAEIFGAELVADYYFNPEKNGFSLFTGLASATGENLTDDKPLDSVNPFEAKFGIKYSSSNSKWDAKLTNTYVGIARVADDTTTFVPDSYTVSDVELTYKPNDKYLISAGVYNLFDQTYYNYQDVKGKATDLSNLTRFTQPERHLKIATTIRF